MAVDHKCPDKALPKQNNSKKIADVCLRTRMVRDGKNTGCLHQFVHLQIVFNVEIFAPESSRKQ